MVRFDTYKASAYLVWQLQHSGAIIQEDGGDIIQVRLPAGVTIRIHLIESPIPVYEIRNTLAYNNASGIHTLFLLWCDLLLPLEGDLVEVQDWEMALNALYSERIYAYDVFGGEIFIFPVHYDRQGIYRHIRYGKTVSVRHLVGSVVDARAGSVRGRHYVAGFEERAQTHHQPPHPHAPSQAGALAEAYALLNLQADAEAGDVKTAYRRLARKLHPDVNKAIDATRQMQALNEAYRRIMDTFEDTDDL